MRIGKKRKDILRLIEIVLICLIAWLFDPDKLSKNEGIMIIQFFQLFKGLIKSIKPYIS